MKLIEWEVNEDNYQEQIVIPEARQKLAAKEGISTIGIVGQGYGGLPLMLRQGLSGMIAPDKPITQA